MPTINYERKDGIPIQHRTAAISYSHDSESYKQWILQLANDLRKMGLAATIDQMESDLRTVNFPQMMNQMIRTNELIIVMCTENYRKRADEFQGGAGYEGQLIAQMLQGEEDRLIICLASGTGVNAIPFFLRGYEYIDFTDSLNYETNLHRIIDKAYGHASVHVEPLGPVPNSSLQSQEKEKAIKVSESTSSKKFAISNLIPPPTDLDKSKFIRQQFEELVRLLTDLFEQVKTERPGFDYEMEQTADAVVKYTGYLQGHRNTGISLRRNTLYGEFGIAVLYGRQSWLSRENSANEVITVHVNDENELVLTLTMDLLERSVPATPQTIVQYFWDRHLQYDFHR